MHGGKKGERLQVPVADERGAKIMLVCTVPIPTVCALCTVMSVLLCKAEKG